MAEIETFLVRHFTDETKMVADIDKCVKNEDDYVVIVGPMSGKIIEPKAINYAYSFKQRKYVLR